MSLVVSDDELVFLIRQKHRDAESVLLDRLRGKMIALVRKYYFLHRRCMLEEADLWNIALKGLYLAVDSYAIEKVHFDAYAHVIIEREIMHSMRQYNQAHHHVLDYATSLDEELDEGTLVQELIGEEDPSIVKRLNNPIHYLLEEDDALTLEERIVLVQSRLGYTLKEIGKTIQKNYRQVARILKLLRHKVPE